MNDVRDDGYPCKNCPIRKEYAKNLDIRFSGEDCFFVCEEYDNWKKELDLYENTVYDK